MTGIADQRQQRGTRRDRRWWRRENWYRDVWLLIISALLCWALFAADADRKERADQSCLLFERQHLRDVQQLEATYEFLLNPPPGLEPLAPVIIAQLGTTEDQARTSTPPAYCRPADVGLARPFPKIPPRPAVLGDQREAHNSVRDVLRLRTQ